MRDEDAQDPEALLQLAAQAAREQRHAEAADIAGRSLRVRDDARAHFLLGALQAQLGLIDRAVESFERALALRPELHLARFQLGLAHLCAARVDAGRGALAPLEDLPEFDPLRWFASGLRQLAEDRFAESAADLRHGMRINAEHPALNTDMQRILDGIASAHVQAPEDGSTGRRLPEAYAASPT